MVMPNIGAFIAWGLITAMFIPGGWFPNEHLAIMVSPMLKYLLPTLIAFTAGKNISGYRGGVAGAVAAMGVIIGTDTPMFLGAMIMGPLAGWCIKKFDSMVKGKVGAGFEMLVDNFSLGIIAMILAVSGYLVIGNVVDSLTKLLSSGVDWMLAHKMNPLLAVLVDTEFNVKDLGVDAPGEGVAFKRDVEFTVAKVFTDSFGSFSRACPTGKAEIYFSVGTAYGTPTLALPYKGDDGHRRYYLGEITIAPAGTL